MDFRQIVPFGASTAIVVKTYRIELNLVALKKSIKFLLGFQSHQNKKEGATTGPL